MRDANHTATSSTVASTPAIAEVTKACIPAYSHTSAASAAAAGHTNTRLAVVCMLRALVIVAAVYTVAEWLYIRYIV